MGKKLYVGNLPFSATEEAIAEIFQTFGTIESVTLVADPDAGAARGFGFVEMQSDAEAQAAIAALNGADFAGRQLMVNEAGGHDGTESSKSTVSGGGGTGGNDW